MIRPMNNDDEQKVIALSREFWELSCENEYGPFDEEHTKAKLASYRSSGACFVTENVDGMLLLVESTNLCNSRPIAAEAAWYVTPSARGGEGVELLQAAIRYCELKNITKLSMIYMQSSMPDSIAKIYDKLGFRLTETTHVRAF